jgi:hypothetical protein
MLFCLTVSGVCDICAAAVQPAPGHAQTVISSRPGLAPTLASG